MRLSLVLPALCLSSASLAAYQVCGGFQGIQCPAGRECVDKTGDNCNPRHGGADCIGICVKPREGKPCGGLKQLPCPKGYKCVDKPGDNCDPDEGDFDCIGMCVKKRKGITKRVEVIETRAASKCTKSETICVRQINACGVEYGGCYDTCKGTKFVAPPCDKPKRCKPASLCIDYINPCGQTYGGCYDTCSVATFTEPPCPSAFHMACGGFPPPTPTPGCPNGYKCVDRPNDFCDPKNGGADCPSWCVPRRTLA